MMVENRDDTKEEKRGEIAGMSYGKLMTALLIPKDSRTNPRRILSGVAFIVFLAFFVFAAVSRGCHREAAQEDRTGPQSGVVVTEARRA